MKRLLLAFAALALLATFAANAQGPAGVYSKVALVVSGSAPSGGCSLSSFGLNTSTNGLYDCPSGNWAGAIAPGMSVSNGLSLSAAGVIGNTPMVSWNIGNTAGAGQAATTATVKVWGYVIPYPLTFSKFDYLINTGDAVNNSDIGLYGPCGLNQASCPLVADIGAQILNTTTTQQQTAASQGSKTIAPGIYWTAYTSAAATIVFANSSFGITALCGSSSATGTVTLGQLPATITTPNCAAPSWVKPAAVPYMVLE